MNVFNSKLNRLICAALLALMLIPITSMAQNNSPCDCTQRWEEGAHWNSDGTIDDTPNSPLEHGIIRCGSSAETQSQVSPLTGCTYDSTSFMIDVASFPCIEPSTGNLVYPINPTQGEPIIFLNFDVRPEAGSFEMQINDGNENVAWALYYSSVITYGVSPNPNGLGVDSTSGSCSSLSLVACGVESANTFSTIPVPNFSQAANYYIAIWDQDADGSVSLGNFKARFGCGDAAILFCNFSLDNPITTCDNNNGTYTLKIPINGINGEYFAYDPNSNNASGLSSPVCLTNPGTTNNTIDTLELTYNQGVAYNVVVFEANDSVPPIAVANGACEDPLNPESCRDTISGPAPNCCLLTASTNTFNADCNGADNASILAIGTGGVAPLTYIWSNGQTIAQAMNLAPGTYTVTITDANQCTATATGSVSEPPALNVQCVLTSNVSCNGGSNGSLSSNVSGGTLLYSYQWSSGSSLSTAENLSAGSYTLVVTDGNGCIDSCSATITEPPLLSCNIAGSDPLCNGTSTGSATVSVGGGTPGYSYSWNDGQTTALATGLSAGTYTVTVTDANQCTSTCTVTLGEPTLLSGNYTLTNLTCNGDSSGTASFPVTGGTQPYSIVWSNGDTTETITGLAAGVYTVLVTDANGCTTGGADLIDEPSAIQTTLTPTSSTCGFANGSISSSVSGGTPGYTYAWSTGATTANISNVSASSYSLIVTDANGCKDTTSTSVNDIGGPSVTADSSNVLCNGGNTGTATATGSGGTSVYTYLWSDNQSTQTATGLVAGTYTVTITDANQCQASATIVVNEPSALSCSTQGTNPLCNGGNDGSATVSGAGGTSPYTYAWSNGQTGASANGLIAGTYTATVTDANQCTSTCTVTLGEPTAIQTTLTPTSSTCGFANGSISSSVSGGTPGYTYAWSTGATTANISNASASSYSLIVTDANGCKDTSSASVNDIGGPSVTADSSDVLCNGGNTGTAIANASGGTPAYTYLWSDNQSTQTATGLIAGTYTVTITDANQCQASTTIVVNEPSALSCSTQGTNPLCNGGNDGSATVSGSGGIPGYTYMWSNGQTGASATGLTAGTYTATVTDANQCTSTCTVTLGEPTLLSGNYTLTDLTCNGNSSGTASFPVTGGTQPYSIVWSNGDTTETITGLAAGIYTVLVTDANGCTTGGADLIDEPSAIQTTLTPTNSTCGFLNGSVSSSISGGTASYTYAWSNGASTQNLNGVAASIYSLIVTDANGCKDTAITFVGDIGGPSVSATGSNPLCNGDSTGTATANPTSGTSGYTYVWSNGQSTQTATGLPAGTYTVTVFDANQCQASTTVTIVDPPVLSCTVTGTNPLCFGGQDGTALAVATGGSDGGIPVIAGLTYYYNWSNGQTNAQATGLGAGTYTVTVSDDNQCTSTCTITLGEPSEMILTKTDTFCFIEYGITAYQHGAELTSVSAGDVNVTITADANQTKPDKVIVFNSNMTGTPDADLEVGLGNLMILPDNMIDANNDLLVDDPNDNRYGGTITLDFSDNVKVVSFKYVDQDDASPSYAKAYDSGNNLISMVTINNGGNGSVQAIVMNADNVAKLEFELSGSGGIGDLVLDCPSAVGQAATGSIDLTVNGGTPGYTYVWSNGASTQDISNVPAGLYTVTVTDDNGCSQTCSTVLSSPNLPLLSCCVTREIECNGGNDGEIFVQAVGGQAPYSILWSTGATSNVLTNCAAGPYAVTITDANGFAVTESMVLGEPEIIDNTVNTPDGVTICYGESATLEAIYEPDCSYQWYKFNNPIPGATNSSITVTGKGKYKVVVTNQTGCAQPSQFITISKFALPTAVISSPGVSFCPGEALDLTAYFDNGYTYKWKHRGNVVGTTTNTYKAIKAGKHKVIVTDLNGCENVSNTINVTKYSRPNVVLDELGHIDICQGSSISINALPSGGLAPYSYTWYKYKNEIQGEITSSYTAWSTGGYSVRVVDANGCSDKTPRTVVTQITCAPRTFEPILSISVYPNPFKDELNVTLLGDEEKPLHIVIYNVLGNVVYEKDVADIYSLNKINLSGVESGMYLLEVRQGNESQHVKINKLK